MYKSAGKENLFVHQIEILQLSEDMKTVWFSDRLPTCTYGRMFLKVRLIKVFLVSSTYLACNRSRKTRGYCRSEKSEY